MSAFIESVRNDFTPTLLAIGAVMFLTWTAAYGLIIIRCFRDKTYGLPLPSIFLNVSWEFLYGFNIVAPLPVALQWGNRLWFVFDVIIVTQVFLYGRAIQRQPVIRRYFYPICVGSLALSVVGLYHFAVYTGDVNGLTASFLMNLAMSIMFISLLFERPTLSGLSYGAAWWKMLGTMTGAAFCYIWWPLQFDATGHLIRPPFVAQPVNEQFNYFLYLTIPIFDGLYVYLHRQRRREMDGSRAAPR